MSFNEKVVLVTGSSAGIGAGIAEKFAEQGAKVVLVARNATKLKEVAAKCEKIGSKPLVVVADVSKDDDAKRIITETINHFGKLDVLVNSAGIVQWGCSILDENTVKVFDQIMSVNLRGVVVLTNLAAPHLVKTKGNIINISSISSTKVYDNSSLAYSVSKAGLDHFTRCIALELAPHGVRANNVNPGPVRTNIFENSTGTSKEHADALWETMEKTSPLGRVAVCEEMADLVSYVASDKAKSITGATLVLDCGFSLTSFSEPQQ